MMHDLMEFQTPFLPPWLSDQECGVFVFFFLFLEEGSAPPSASVARRWRLISLAICKAADRL